MKELKKQHQEELNRLGVTVCLDKYLKMVMLELVIALWQTQDADVIVEPCTC